MEVWNGASYALRRAGVALAGFGASFGPNEHHTANPPSFAVNGSTT